MKAKRKVTDLIAEEVMEWLGSNFAPDNITEEMISDAIKKVMEDYGFFSFPEGDEDKIVRKSKLRSEELDLLSLDRFKEKMKKENIEKGFIDKDELAKKSQELLGKMKEFRFRVGNIDEIGIIKNEPGYKRKNVEFDSLPKPAETNTHRLTLGKMEGGKTIVGRKKIHD